MGAVFSSDASKCYGSFALRGEIIEFVGCSSLRMMVVTTLTAAITLTMTSALQMAFF